MIPSKIFIGFGGNIENITIAASTLITRIATASPRPISATSFVLQSDKKNVEKIGFTINRVTHDFVYGNIIYAIYVYQIMSAVLSVRVRKELKEKAEQLGINIRDVVERALEEAIKEKEREEINDIARKIKELMKDVSEEEWVEAIRGERNER